MASEPATAFERVRVFISSPRDVEDARALAFAVVDQLESDPFFRESAHFEVVAWDKPGARPPIFATGTPQASLSAGLPLPSACDVVVVVLWSRMGTPLPQAQYGKPDGRPYRSGTEWEFQDALAGAGRGNGRPVVLLYRRTTPVAFNPDDPSFEEQVRQRQMVKEFFAELREAETGAIRHGYKEYNAPDEFRSEFDSDLRHVLRSLLPGAGTKRVVDPAPLWRGSPFPGLRSFTPADAPIFFGRGRETDRLVERIRANRLVAVVGASGSGKSSLVGAGLIP